MFSGLGVVGREVGAAQGDKNDAEMDGPMQESKRAGGLGGESGSASETTTENCLGRVSSAGFSSDTRLGGVGSGRFVSFWLGRGGLMPPTLL